MTDEDPASRDVSDRWATPVDLDDDRVTTARCTCPHHPAQYEGTLTDGRHFYYRYRWGWAYVGVGNTPDEAVDDERHSLDYGGPYAGAWPDDATRNAKFRDLLDRALRDTEPPVR